MTGIDDLIICPRCLRPMGDDISTMVCQYCGYEESEEKNKGGLHMTENKRFKFNGANNCIEYDGKSILLDSYGEDVEELLNELHEENEQLKEVLGSILVEVRRDISATNHCGEVNAFVTPNSFDLIVDVLKKYGALKGWYE